MTDRDMTDRLVQITLKLHELLGELQQAVAESVAAEIDGDPDTPLEEAA